MRTRQRCFLDHPTWRAVLHDPTKPLETPEDAIRAAVELWYIELCRHTKWKAEFTRFSTTSDPSVCEKLLASGQAVRSCFKEALTRVGDALRMDEMEPIVTSSKRKDSLFPTMFNFQNPSIGSIYCGHWTELSSIDQMLGTVARRLAHLLNMDQATCSGLQAGYDLECVDNSRNVCMSMESLSNANPLDSTQLVIALQTAMHFLNSESEVAWIRKEMQRISAQMDIAKNNQENDMIESDHRGRK